MRRIATILLLILLATPLSFGAARLSRWRTVWRVSEVLLAGADAADAASSWGKNEANPLLRSGQSFSYGSLAIKLTALGGSMAAQRYLLRRAPERTPVMASTNVAAAAVLGAIAVRNMRIPAAK